MTILSDSDLYQIFYDTYINVSILGEKNLKLILKDGKDSWRRQA